MNKTHKTAATTLAPTLHQPAFSGMATYCQVTGLALAITAHFGGTPLAGSVLPSFHPALLVPTTQLLEVAASYRNNPLAGTPTEQYLLVVATLHSLNLLESRTPLTPADKYVPKLWAAYCSALVAGTWTYLVRRIADGKPARLPTYAVSTENCTDLQALTHYIDTIAVEVANVQEFHAVIAAGRSAPVRKKSQLDVLEDELALELELKAIMAGPVAVRYNSKCRKKALQQLAASDCPPAAIYVVRQCLDGEANPSEQQLRDARDTCKDFLDLHSDAHREVSLAVIKHLEVLLQKMLEVEEELGFIILEEEAGAASKTVQYKTKTKAVDAIDVMVLPTRQAGRRLSLQEQLELRRAAKATTTPSQESAQV